MVTAVCKLSSRKIYPERGPDGGDGGDGGDVYMVADENLQHPLSITVLLNLTALSVVKMAKAVIVRENVVKILLLMSLWGRVPIDLLAAGEIIC